MINKSRRQLIGGLGVIFTSALSGCSSDSTPSTEEIINFPEHSFEYQPESENIDIYFTVENTSEREITNIKVTFEVYDGETRIDDTYMFVKRVTSGTQVEENLLLTDLNPDDISRYRILLQVCEGDTFSEVCTTHDRFVTEYNREDFTQRLSNTTE